MTPAGTNLLLAHADATPAPSDVVTKSLRFEKSSTANLNQDNPSGADARQMTLSFWVKLVETPSADRKLFAFGGSAVGGTSQSEQEVIQKTDGKINVRTNVINTGVYSAYTTRVFRDFSSWYHIVIAWDTDQSVAADRMKFYVNNEQETLTGTFPSLNYNDRFGQTGTNVKNRIGCGVDGASAYGPSSSYMADIIRIDGQQLTPTSFAEEDATTGQWKPKAFVGVYGTAGFHLDFEDDTAIGNDVSGEGNDFTATNLATSDIVNDTPTDNYAVLNPLVVTHSGVGYNTFSEGNTKVVTDGGGRPIIPSTIFMPPDSGTYYAEFTLSVGAAMYGIARGDVLNADDCTTSSKIWGYESNAGTQYKVNSGTYVSLGTAPTYPVKNGVSYNTATGEVKFFVGGSDIGGYTGLSTDYSYGFFVGDGSTSVSATITTHFDSGDWDNTPSGAKQLSTANLPTPTIAKPSAHFNALTYASSGAKTGVGFQPDLVWVKARGNTYNHELTDSVRGVTKALSSNDSEAESTDSTGLTAFGTDGFTVGAGTNYSTSSMVAWSWKESATAGMDMVIWTGDDDGTGASPTPQAVSHSLGVAPDLIIAKSRTQNTFHNFDWIVWHKDLTSGNYLLLNGLGAETGWGDALVSSIGSSSVTFGSDAMMSGEDLNAGASFGSADDYVAYLFASVEGYSKCGIYTGNGSAAGPFVYCGFRPAFILIKSTGNPSSNGYWMMKDEVRSTTYNPADGNLYANEAFAEDTTSTVDIDFLSNGFKIKGTYAGINATGSSYIFYAVAESPFKYASAR